LRSLTLGGERSSHLVGDCADIEILPRLAVDVNRETKGLLMREFLREFLALERVKSVHISIVHGYMIAGFRKVSRTSVQIFQETSFVPIAWKIGVGTIVARGPPLL